MAIPIGTAQLTWDALDDDGNPIVLDPAIYAFQLNAFTCIEEFPSLVVDGTLAFCGGAFAGNQFIGTIPVYTIPAGKNHFSNLSVTIYEIATSALFDMGVLHGTNLAPAPPAYDADAQAFIDAVEITDTLTTTEKDAINQMVLDMKSASIWTKGHVYYPMVGGTASAHKWNLFNPVDSDAAFRATFGGGWTHNSSGAQGNGSTGYINSHVVPFTDLTQDSTCAVYSSATTAGAYGAEFGYDGPSNNPRWVMALSYDGTSGYVDTYNFPTGRVLLAIPDRTGVFIDTRTSGSVHKYFRDAVQLGATNTGASLSGGKTWADLSTKLAFQAVSFSGGYAGYSGRICQGAGLFDGLNDTEVSNLTTAINTFNTSLSR